MAAGDGKPVETLPLVVDSTVSTHSVSHTRDTMPKAPESLLSQTGLDSTVSKVVSLEDARRKRAVDSTVSKPSRRSDSKGKKHSDSKAGKRSDSKLEPAPKPQALKGHEWRRQGTGWTLLRSRYEPDGNGTRVKRRKYVQHYSATALRMAGTLKEKLL